MLRYAVFCGSTLLLAGCGLCPGPEPATYSLKVVPDAIVDAIPAQRCILLLSIEESGWQPAGPVTVTATADGGSALVEYGTISAGEIAEVTITVLPLAESMSNPNDAANERICTATIRAERDGEAHQAIVPITVTSEEHDEVAPLAAEMRGRFIPWLSEERPELAIDEHTVWSGTIVTPHILVVTHYLYFSDQWELHVFWHVTIPPYDWARIELRRRFQEARPSLAFEIPSVTAEDPESIREIEPADRLWR